MGSNSRARGPWVVLLACVAFAGSVEAGGDHRPRLALEAGVLRHAARGDIRDVDSVGLNAVVRASLFVTRGLYVGAELGLAPPDLLPLYARAADASARLEEPMSGAYAGAALRLGAFRLKGEVLVGARALRLTAPGPEGSASRLVLSGLRVQPRVGVDLWLGRHVTVGVLAGWTREVVSTGLMLGLHLAPRDRC